MGGSLERIPTTPDEMLWVVKWKVDAVDENPFDRPVDEVLTVWGNGKAEAALLKMVGVSGSRNLAWKMLAAEITTEIWWEVITKIQPTTTFFRRQYSGRPGLQPPVHGKREAVRRDTWSPQRRRWT